jgi:hypothetical protein
LRLGLWSKVCLTHLAYSGVYSPKCLVEVFSEVDPLALG